MTARRIFLIGSLLVLSACATAPQGTQTTSYNSVFSSESSIAAMSSASSQAPIPGPYSDDLQFNFVFTTSKQFDQSNVQKLWMLDQSGMHQLIPDNFISYPRMINNGAVYINDINGQKFKVFGLDGSDITEQYPQFNSAKFDPTAWLPIGNGRAAYNIFPEGQTGDTGLFIVNGDGTTTNIPVSKFYADPHLLGIEPICISADGRSLYARMVPWEGFIFEEVFRVNLSDLSITKVITRDDTIYNLHCQNGTDTLIAAKTDVNEGFGMGGAPQPPASIVLYDLAGGTTRVLASSQKDLLTNPVLTPDGKHIFYVQISANPHPEQYESPFWGSGADAHIMMMDRDGSHQRDLGKYEEVVGMSRDGSLIVTKHEDYQTVNTFFLLDVKNGTSQPIQVDDQRITEVRCPRGFDCLY